MVAAHPELLVGRLRSLVAAVDVETEAEEPGVFLDLPADVLVEGAEDAPAARRGDDVDRLDPPPGAGAPVAPIRG